MNEYIVLSITFIGIKIKEITEIKSRATRSERILLRRCDDTTNTEVFAISASHLNCPSRYMYSIAENRSVLMMMKREFKILRPDDSLVKSMGGITNLDIDDACFKTMLKVISAIKYKAETDIGIMSKENIYW